jgi:NAD(P)-dependent dehydrogenase (short-subunit alcohol dehydrogenase family)
MHDKPVIILTGASRGVGSFVARWLGKAGAGVALIARSSGALNEVAGDVKRLGGAPTVFAADISNPEACRLAVEKTLDRFGRIDALVNNAGIVQPIASIAQADPESWRKNIEVNSMVGF